MFKAHVKYEKNGLQAGGQCNRENEFGMLFVAKENLNDIEG